MSSPDPQRSWDRATEFRPMLPMSKADNPGVSEKIARIRMGRHQHIRIDHYGRITIQLRCQLQLAELLGVPAGVRRPQRPGH